MTSTQLTPRRPLLRFALHYAEMVVAMLVGMVALGPLWSLAWPGLDAARMDVQVLVMATDMALGMGIWMRVRGHSWRGTAEMSAAMYVPFALVAVPFWTGMISGGTFMVVGHVLMLPAMAVPMLLRRHEYAGCA